MTRDFTLEFNNNNEAKEAEQELMQCKDENNNRIFNMIDNRGDTSF